MFHGIIRLGDIFLCLDCIEGQGADETHNYQTVNKFYYICYSSLSYEVASGSDITQCNKIYKPLMVYQFTGNFMKHTIWFQNKFYVIW